jgi:hypothetical protein
VKNTNQFIEKFKTRQNPSWEKVGEMRTVLTQKAELPIKGGLAFLLREEIR